MKNINSVTLRGQLGFDPEVKEVAGGRWVGRFSLATNIQTTKFDGSIANETQWHTVVAWGSLADQLRDFRKGDAIHVEGRIVHRAYFPKNGGEKRNVTEIVAHHITKPA